MGLMAVRATNCEGPPCTFKKFIFPILAFTEVILCFCTAELAPASEKSTPRFLVASTEDHLPLSSSAISSPSAVVLAKITVLSSEIWPPMSSSKPRASSSAKPASEGAKGSSSFASRVMAMSSTKTLMDPRSAEAAKDCQATSTVAKSIALSKKVAPEQPATMEVLICDVVE